VYPDAKKKLKMALDKRKVVLKQAKTSEKGVSNSGSKKRPPPPLAFGLSDKSAKSGPAVGTTTSKETNDDAAINKLTANDIDPLPPWSKRRKRSIDSNTPNMQCLASMLLADPFVMRILLDKVLRTIRMDMKEKCLHSSMLLPSMFQLINIANMSVQLCKVKGRKYNVPDIGITNTAVVGMDEISSYKSLRRFFPLFSKMLLDVEVRLFACLFTSDLD